MRLWFAANSDVPIYRQMHTQISLAILSGDLKPGDKLPSTRDLARRFGLHANTISAGYRLLERDGWTEMRHGSGVYVRSNAQPAVTPEQSLDRHIAGVFRAVRELKLPEKAVRDRVAAWLAAPSPDRLLLIDPDQELRQILLAELTAIVQVPVLAATIEEALSGDTLRGAVPLCRPSKADSLRAALPAGVELITLPIRSATAWLAPWLPAPRGVLVAVASHWPEFVQTAKTMLVAGGLAADALILRDARTRGWNRGLDQATVILCDAHTATHPRLPAGVRVIVFPLLADAAKAELAEIFSSALL